MMMAQDRTRAVGKYWTHEDDCGVPGQHVHYGQNVVLLVPHELGPLLNELRAENERLRSQVRLALQYLTGGSRQVMATPDDAQAAVDTLLALTNQPRR